MNVTNIVEKLILRSASQEKPIVAKYCIPTLCVTAHRFGMGRATYSLGRCFSIPPYLNSKCCQFLLCGFPVKISALYRPVVSKFLGNSLQIPARMRSHRSVNLRFFKGGLMVARKSAKLGVAEEARLFDFSNWCNQALESETAARCSSNVCPQV